MIATTETKLPRLVTALPGPNARRVVENDTKFMSPSYTRDYPLVAKRGHGAIVEDVDGNSFLDFAAGIAVCSTGNCHPKVVAAIQQQAAELIHMSGTDFYYESMPMLAERLVNTLSGTTPKKAFFTNSGAEAVEGAIKLARYATKRDKMIAFYGCFHGRTMGALSLTASKTTQRKGFGALLSGVEHIPFPDAYRCAHGHTMETCGAEILELLGQETGRYIEHDMGTYCMREASGADVIIEKDGKKFAVQPTSDQMDYLIDAGSLRRGGSRCYLKDPTK